MNPVERLGDPLCSERSREYDVIENLLESNYDVIENLLESDYVAIENLLESNFPE